MQNILKNKILVFFRQNFLSESLICSFIMSDLSELLKVAHLSWLMSDLSDLLTVAHLSWATWAIPSWSLICLEQSEQITHSRSFELSEMSEWANERMSEWVMSKWVNAQPCKEVLKNCWSFFFLTGQCHEKHTNFEFWVVLLGQRTVFTFSSLPNLIFFLFVLNIFDAGSEKYETSL